MSGVAIPEVVPILGAETRVQIRGPLGKMNDKCLPCGELMVARMLSELNIKPTILMNLKWVGSIVHAIQNVSEKSMDF